jgi:DNA polymerase I-like protein with 3'-5' exonuclease and polymerase domains
VARVLYTDELDPNTLDEEQLDFVYNAKDCCVTHQVDTALEERLNEAQRRIYRFELAQQAVAFSMMKRGLRVNLNVRDGLLHELTQQRQRINTHINNLANAMWSRGLNPKSPKQMHEFFYDHLKLPIHHRQEKGRRVPTTNIEALEGFRAYFYIKPIVNAILASGDLHGQIKVLAAGIDPDNRFRASFNVGGTETGRWSSSYNPNRRGTNLQNITERMRCAFIADEGEIFVSADLEQAESFVVAYTSGDERYIDACKSGDLHTTVAKLIWPSAGWTGDPKDDRRLAEQPDFYRHWCRRDLSKRAGHLSNYWGTHYKLAAALGLELDVAERFQHDYFSVFSLIPRWHQWVVSEVQSKSVLTTPLGRRRAFFGRLRDDRTLKEAIAYVPQSTIGDLLNLGLLKVWHWLQLREKRIHCQLQLHDGFLAGVPEDELDGIVSRMKELMTIPLVVNGRTMVVPVAFKVGYNWRDMKPYGSEEASKLRRDDTTYDPTKWMAG